MSVDEKLIKNLENQVARLLQQITDLEEERSELTDEEYESMKEETLEQIKDFSESLDRMNKGDLTIKNKFSTMRAQIRSAIASSFNTVEMIKLFGEQTVNELETQLLEIDQQFKLKKITQLEMEAKKSEILDILQKNGCPLSENDQKFLREKLEREVRQLQDISPDS